MWGCRCLSSRTPGHRRCKCGKAQHHSCAELPRENRGTGLTYFLAAERVLASKGRGQYPSPCHPTQNECGPSGTTTYNLFPASFKEIESKVNTSHNKTDLYQTCRRYSGKRENRMGIRRGGEAVVWCPSERTTCRVLWYRGLRDNQGQRFVRQESPQELPMPARAGG